MKFKIDHKRYREVSRQKIRDQQRTRVLLKQYFKTQWCMIKRIALGFWQLIWFIFSIVYLPILLLVRFASVVWQPWYYSIRLIRRLTFSKKYRQKLMKIDDEEDIVIKLPDQG